MNPTIYQPIKFAIASADKNEVLSEERIEELAGNLTTFIEAAILKYIRGQEEHGGNISDRDLDTEILNEIIDLMHYHQARKEKGR